MDKISDDITKSKGDPSPPAVAGIKRELQDNETEEKRPVKAQRSDGRKYVEKNSLNEDELLLERDRTRDMLKNKKEGEATNDEIKAVRRAANRLSAFQSRQRRKLIVGELKKQVSDLTKLSESQAEEIKQLKETLKKAQEEAQTFRLLASGGMPQQPQMFPQPNAFGNQEGMQQAPFMNPMMAGMPGGMQMMPPGMMNPQMGGQQQGQVMQMLQQFLQQQQQMGGNNPGQQQMGGGQPGNQQNNMGNNNGNGPNNMNPQGNNNQGPNGNPIGDQQQQPNGTNANNVPPQGNFMPQPNQQQQQPPNNSNMPQDGTGPQVQTGGNA